MLDSLLAVIAFLFAIFSVVIVHEFGHFICARIYYIKILRFSIGFGRSLWCIHDKKGTEYVLAAIPLGGYVKLSDTREGLVGPLEIGQAFDRRPVYQRFTTILAGPAFNLLFSLCAFWLVFTMGISFVKPIVGSVIPNSPAAHAGLQNGEEIIAIDDIPAPNWMAVSMLLLKHYGETGKLVVTVQNIAASRQVTINLQEWKLDALHPNLLKSIGIAPAGNRFFRKVQYSALAAIVEAGKQVVAFTQFNLMVFYKIITGVISWQSLGGPLTIFSAATLAAGQGIVVYINFLALLSISIAVLNLLPIPGLDGAQLVYLIIEKIRGKPLSTALQLLVFRLGMIALILLMLQVMLNDLLRLL